MRTRSRSRSDAHDESFVLSTVGNNGTHLWGPETWSVAVGTYLESILDTVGVPRGVNPVQHFKVTSAIAPPRFLHQKWYGWLDATFSTGGYPFFPFSGDYFANLLPFVPPSVRDIASGEALTSLTNEFAPQVDIVNFAFENRQIGDLIPKISRSITKTASGAYLGWKFGLKPTLSDLKKLSNLTDYVGKRLAFLRNTYGTRTRVGFQKRIDARAFLPSEKVLFFDAIEGTSIKLELAEAGCSFRAGGYLTHRLSGLNDLTAEAAALSATLGTSNPAAILWEAIPFSFVADWFAHVQSFVATLNVQPFKGEYKLEGMSHSFHTVVTYRLVLHRGPGDPAFSTGAVEDCGSLSLSRYERYPGIPAQASWLTDASLTPTQQMLALSLVRQRF